MYQVKQFNLSDEIKEKRRQIGLFFASSDGNFNCL